jgi:hypothetical protein
MPSDTRIGVVGWDGASIEVEETLSVFYCILFSTLWV